jgi:hypothetical protein
MLSQLLIGWGLLALCVAIHASGITSALRYLDRAPVPKQDFWPWTWLFVRVAGWVVLIHLAEIVVWAAFYVWSGAMPDLQTAAYFSGVTYTTTGYGDLLLAKDWRLVGGVESLTGILMCGWSTGFFFAAVARMHEARPKTKET